MAAPTAALFQPIQVGDIELAHRVVFAPLTRFRATGAHVPTDLMVEYYAQRGSVPGSLLIAEATDIAPQAGGMANVPGIYSDEQITAWKKVTDAVHAKGSYIFLQIWALGRVARPELLKLKNPDYPHVAPSPVPIPGKPDDVPRELTKEEIKQYVEWHRIAAHNAVHRAGFDGVEVHGANGFLVDQFLRDITNKRTDEYGGSIENRVRFALEVLDSISAAVGQKKTAIRLSPWLDYLGVRLDDPIPIFGYLVEQIKKRFPDLAYIHTITHTAPLNSPPTDESQVDFIYKLWNPRRLIVTGALDRESGIKLAEETGQLVGFGRTWLANPDFPFRLRENLPLNEPDEATFYAVLSEKGYTTYPFSEEFLQSRV